MGIEISKAYPCGSYCGLHFWPDVEIIRLGYFHYEGGMHMSVKLFVTDLDGTLLPSGKDVPCEI